MSLLIGVCETSMHASFALNMYEITHEVSLVLAFWCIGIEAPSGLVYHMAYFISSGESKSLQHWECCIYSLLLVGL